MIHARPEITGTAPAHHGAFDYDELARLGLSAEDVLDFSVNSNPYGPPPGVREAIGRVPLDRYPDRECIALREKLAALHDVPPDHIVVGNGTAELLNLIACAFLERGTKAIIPAATFSEYGRAARLAGAQVEPLPRLLPVDPEAWFADHAGRIAAARIIFLCNPYNPDGLHLSTDQIVSWAAQHPHTLFVIDEAYGNFLREPQSVILARQPNILTIRSLTKDYALAGLRLGYAVGGPDVIAAVRSTRPAWNVNALAQAAGLVVLDQHSWLRATIAQLHANKDELVDGLHKLGLTPHPSAVNYFLVDVGDGAAFRSDLLHHRVMVRDCASFGLPEYVRIAARIPQENAQLLAAIAQVRA